MDKWCPHLGINEQYIRCENATDDGDTCINPTIRSGTIEGGIPSKGYMIIINNITEWCQTIFGIGNYGSATWGNRNCKYDHYSVIWSTTNGKFRKWEKDSWNQKCSSTKLMTSVTCKEAHSGILITSFCCRLFNFCNV